jgi:hypothetical protein
MEHYVTLFDSLFLPQGLALHMSMERHVGAYTLWILCVDNEVEEALTKLELPNVRLLQLSKLETPELLEVKHTRSIGEYCWTLTPFSLRFVFEADSGVSRVTYLDADMWFRKNPVAIFSEFDTSRKNVLITDHAYSPEHDQSETSGQYCVQFMTFTRDEGEVVRKWWEDRCIEWCFSRCEDGKFGDQKYLDDWTTRFADSVHVLSNKELTLAPWNATRFPYGNAITWHFHSLRIFFNSRKLPLIIHGIYLLPKCTRKNVYQPYLVDLYAAIQQSKSIGVVLKSQMTLSLVSFIKLRLLMLLQRLWIFNTNFVSRL